MGLFDDEIIEEEEIDYNIELTSGERVWVDESDYVYLKQWKWTLDGKSHPARQSGFRCIYLHAEVFRRMGGKGTADHRDRDRLNCRRSNLRPSTRQQNSANTGIRSDNNSGYKGVRRRRQGDWGATIHIRGRNIALGVFETREEAALAYNRAALRLFGEYAVLNEVPNA